MWDQLDLFLIEVTGKGVDDALVVVTATIVTIVIVATLLRNV